MTGFFEQQDRARRTTRVLLVLMALAITGMAFAIYSVLHWLSTFGHRPDRVQPELFLTALFGTAALVALASGSRLLSLRGGGAQIAEMLGGRIVSGHPQDALEKRLLNVAEEMAIAAGVPVPSVFVLDAESGINAFAAGLNLNDAALCVTRGCLEKLTREELQGVVAHEFSHILNGDMRLNIRLMGVVFGIMCIGMFGRLLMRFGQADRWAEERSKSPGPIALFAGLAIVVVGAVGEFFGKLIKAAVSRQREYLADASAVQFTRNPHGIAGALKKIGGFSEGGRVGGRHAEEASHFFFADIHMNVFAVPWFATHPPLADRVARLDPGFAGTFPAVAAGIAQPVESEAGVLFLAGPTAPSIVESVGTTTASSVDYAKALLDRIPPELHAAIGVPFSARAVVYAMLLSDEPAVLQLQRASIAKRSGQASLLDTDRLAPLVRAFPRRDRLPLAELLSPALRALTREQRGEFSDAVASLIDADQAVTIFEYVLSHTLAARLSEPRPRPRFHYRSLRSVERELALLLSLLAHAGAYDPEAAAAAFARGVARLPGARPELALLPASTRLLSGLSEALDVLSALLPSLAERVVDACAHIVIADRRVSDDELTLLRAVCGAMHCPLPPLLARDASIPP